ncbi:cyclin-D2-1 [Prunus yedoensis var. nudiflora]|uniref:Cyclin-D2-1 n=1 Tax=Prunus yedoensis var. nudiflora TaxID=2094558 RepID=A0A314YV45_PRUYE|nr:cyclin-D2-1 [Prunus yedoensis var. nudiflora]
MADSFDCANSNLLCAENSDTCFDDLNSNTIDDLGLFPSMSHKIDNTHNQDPSFNHNRSKSMIDFPLQSEEGVSSMVKRESEHFPRDDYLKRLRNGDLDLSSRREALDWISKVRVLKCLELIKDLSLISGSANRGSAASSVPQSPVGVLDAACLSYKSDEFTVGSCANSSHRSPDIKRRKPDNPSKMDSKS